MIHPADSLGRGHQPQHWVAAGNMGHGDIASDGKNPFVTTGNTTERIIDSRSGDSLPARTDFSGSLPPIFVLKLAPSDSFDQIH